MRSFGAIHALRSAIIKDLSKSGMKRPPALSSACQGGGSVRVRLRAE